MVSDWDAGESLWFHQLVDLPPGRLYRWSFWIRTASGTADVRCHVYKGGIGDLGGRRVDVDTTYQKVEFLVAGFSSHVSTNAWCGIAINENTTIYIDDASLEDITDEVGYSFDTLST